MTADDDPVLTAARIDPLVAAEHPGLRVWSARVPGGVGRSDPGVRDRLCMLSERVRGAQAVAMRAQPVPSAYRVLFRQLGLDPDVTRTPLEALVLDRLLHGGLQPRGLPEDALAIATLETGVPVWAADAQRVGGPLVVEPRADGRLVVADEHGAVAVLFEPPAADRAPHKRTTELLLIAVQAPGVDDMHVEEAVWTAASAMPTIDTPS